MLMKGGPGARRLAVAFQRVFITLGPLPALVVPLGWINDGKGPEGWLAGPGTGPLLHLHPTSPGTFQLST